jgi:hypothetical protein
MGIESSSFRTLLGDSSSESVAIAAKLRFYAGGLGDGERTIISSPEEMEGAPGGLSESAAAWSRMLVSLSILGQ